jgi:uncharacterized DUF497 family protein
LTSSSVLPIIVPLSTFRRYIGGMSLSVEWDPAKAEANLGKHGVSFEEAATVLGDLLSITLADPDHSQTEERFLLLGRSATGRFLLLSIAERADIVRIISARSMTPRERRAYEREIEG